MSWRWQIALSILALAAVLAVFDQTDLDLRVQDRFFDFSAGRWLINTGEPLKRWVFYIGPKVLLVIAGISCTAAYALSFKVPPLRAARRGCLLMVLSLAIVPSTVAVIKEFTNVYTPAQMERYGGKAPYVKVLEKYPRDFRQPWSKRGKGWPASHASGGLSLMMLYFAARRRRWKLLGLAGGLAAGWIMGLYQTLNGQHYLSHTFVSMILAWVVIVLLNRLVEGLGRASNPKLAALAACQS